MNETDYINATNLARLRCLKDIARDLTAGGALTADRIKTLHHVLDDAEGVLETTVFCRDHEE